jgi:hypothetical protein
VSRCAHGFAGPILDSDQSGLLLQRRYAHLPCFESREDFLLETVEGQGLIVPIPSGTRGDPAETARSAGSVYREQG